MERASWLITDGVERTRMLEMDRRLRPVRRQVFVMLGAGFAASSPWIGWWPIGPLIAVAVLFELGDQLAGKASRPEYVNLGVWAGSELVIALCLIALGKLGTICFLAVPIPTLASRFSGRGIAVGALFSIVLLLGTAASIDVDAVAREPATVLAPAAVIGSIAWFMKGGVMPDGLEIRRTSLIDPLTGLLNRAALEARVEEYSSQSPPPEVGVIAVDVDGFKAINDRFGHHVGDAVLREVAGRLRNRLRGTDLVFRCGGEEFVVLLPGAGEGQAAAVAQEVCAAIHEKRCAGVEVTVSCGVAVSSRGPFDYELLFRRADEALYRAKGSGRDCVEVASPIAI